MTHPRKGSTLIELILTVSAGTVMMLLAVTLIHQSMTWSQRMATRNRDLQSMQRLAEMWRDDCRSGIAVESRSENLSVVRLSDQRRIEYEMRPGIILRRDISESNQAETTTHNEKYEFNARSRFTIEQMDAPKRSRLIWKQMSEISSEPETVCVVDGVLEGEFSKGGDR